MVSLPSSPTGCHGIQLLSCLKNLRQHRSLLVCCQRKSRTSSNNCNNNNNNITATTVTTTESKPAVTTTATTTPTTLGSHTGSYRVSLKKASNYSTSGLYKLLVRNFFGGFWRVLSNGSACILDINNSNSSNNNNNETTKQRKSKGDGQKMQVIF